MVLITHDNSIAVKAKRIVRIQDGSIIYDGDAHDPQGRGPAHSLRRGRGGGIRAPDSMTRRQA